jgi:hypothetical protein
LLCLPIGLVLFVGIWLAGDALISLLNAHTWATNDHLLRGTLADPLIFVRICLSVVVSGLGARAAAVPLLHRYTSLALVPRRILRVIAGIACILSGCIIFAWLLALTLSLTSPTRASTDVAGYRIHLVERGTDDLDFGELVLMVTRADGAFYEQRLEYTTQDCREFTTTTAGVVVTLQCSFPRGQVVTVNIDRQQQTLRILRDDQPAILQSLTTLPYTKP